MDWRNHTYAKIIEEENYVSSAMRRMVDYHECLRRNGEPVPTELPICDHLQAVHDLLLSELEHSLPQITAEAIVLLESAIDRIATGG